METLDLEENALGGEGTAYIADMLKENGFITGLVSHSLYYRGRLSHPILSSREFVCLLVGSFVALFVISSKRTRPIVVKSGTDIQHLSQILPLTCEKSRSKFKVNSGVVKYPHCRPRSLTS